MPRGSVCGTSEDAVVLANIVANRRHLLRSSALLAASVTIMPLQVSRASAHLQTATGVAPVQLRVQHALVNAPVEPREVTDGVIQDPTAVWAPSWIRESGGLGIPTNVVMFGYSHN